MIIYPYQRIPEKITKTVNADWGIGRSDNGWMTAETFFQYIANVFHPYLIEKNVTLPVLLFVDGHKSHLTYELSVLCKELQIEVVALYPNATRILQPADVAVFRPIKMAWRQAVRDWYADHPEQVLNRISFAPLLEKVVESSVKPETLINGFQACGLCPFNPDAIDFSKCLGAVNDGNSTNNPNSIVPDISMKYNAFATIVGAEKLQKFKSLDQYFPDEIDENFFDLYRIWKHYENQHKEKSKDKAVNDNVEQIPEHNKKVNILQNVVIKPANNSTNASSSAIYNCSDFDRNVLQGKSKSEPCSRMQSPIPSTSGIASPLPSNVVEIVQSELLGNYLIRPDAPQRKGIKNIERFPFAITAKKYQMMFEKKRALQEIAERKKEENRKKRENGQAAKRALQETKLSKKGTKRPTEEVQANKQSNAKKAKCKENKNICGVCLKMIRSQYELHCDDCTKCFHKLCIPKSHRIHIPNEEDDKYLCHNCYKEESESDVTEPGTAEQVDEENVEESEDEGPNGAETENEYGKEEKGNGEDIKRREKETKDREKGTDGKEGTDGGEIENIKELREEEQEEEGEDKYKDVADNACDSEVDELFDMYNEAMKNFK